MRNKMGCLVFGLLALLVIMFFNGGGNQVAESPSDVSERSTDGGSADEGGSGALEPLGDLDAGGDESEGDDSSGGVSLDLESVDGSDEGSATDGLGGNVGVLSGEPGAQVSDVRYTVLEATNKGHTYDTLEADGEFIVVSLQMENTGTEPLTYLGANMIDDHGQEYSYVPEGLDYIFDEEVCEAVTIEPGEERICTMFYDVNEDANAIGLILTDLNLLGGEESVVELTGLP